MTSQLIAIIGMLRIAASRLGESVKSEEGTVAETVVIVGILVALAIAAGAIITSKVVSAANNINMGS